MNRQSLKGIPGLVSFVHFVRDRMPFIKWTLSPKRLVFNESFVWLAERYLEKHYAFHSHRLWGGPHERPEWFDHRADLYQWSKRRIPFWVERGVFSREVMSEGSRVLDLCCGDGFYPYYFYSETASQIVALDRDPAAIAHARKWHRHPRIRFVEHDLICDEFTDHDFDVVTWDGAIEHFSLDQIRRILSKCVKVMRRPQGVLNGYTLISREPAMSHPDHQYEFRSAEDLKQILMEFFPFVGTTETVYPERHNLYFRAAFHPDRLKRFE
jgi:ubiquinone/menaquinone biosynthesis C-methylase UbiE